VVTRAGKRLAGAAFERFGESVHDIRAAIALAVKSGYRRMILAGHSTGAYKVLHYLAPTRDRRVVGLILLGPVSDVAGERKRIGRRELARRDWGTRFVADPNFAPMYAQRSRIAPDLQAVSGVEDVAPAGAAVLDGRVAGSGLRGP
jgi:alpha-beta hydrolase superfamily lysophospholipase